MDKIIILTIQLAVSMLIGFFVISFVMMTFNPALWGIVARVSFLAASAAFMVGLIKLTGNE